MTAYAEPTAELSPTRALVARMLLSTEDAREIADAVDVSEVVGRPERDIFAFLGVMASEGKVSPRTAYLTAKAQAPALADPIRELAHAAIAPDFDSAQPVADVVRWYRDWNLRRELTSHLQYRMQELEDGILSAEMVVSSLATVVERIQSRQTDRRSYDDMDEQLQRVSDYIRNPAPAGLPFGFKNIDSAMVPLIDGNLCLLGGPSGSGKSTIARNLFRNWRKERPIYFSLEMSADDQLLHLACMEANIPITAAVKRQLTPKQIIDMELAGLAWKKSGARINERSTMGPVDLLRAMKRYRAAGHRLFVVDHAHRIDYGTENDEKSLRVAIGTLAKRLKSFAVDTGSIVVALVQLTKQSRNTEPGDESIRESNQILEEADKVLLTWRPLVVGKRSVLGDFTPNWPRKLVQHGQKPPKDCVAGEDASHIWIKPGKQRIAPIDTLFMIKFHAHSGHMYDASDRDE